MNRLTVDIVVGLQFSFSLVYLIYGTNGKIYENMSEMWNKI